MICYYYYYTAYPACSACTVCLMQCCKSRDEPAALKFNTYVLPGGFFIQNKSSLEIACSLAPGIYRIYKTCKYVKF